MLKNKKLFFILVFVLIISIIRLDGVISSDLQDGDYKPSGLSLKYDYNFQEGTISYLSDPGENFSVKDYRGVLYIKKGNYVKIDQIQMFT